MTALWIVAAVGGWLAVSLPVAVLVGRSIRIAEKKRAPHPGRRRSEGSVTRING